MEYEGHRRDGDASSWWRQSRKLVHHFHIRAHTLTRTHTHTALNTKRLPTLLSLRNPDITERHRAKTFLPWNTHKNQRWKLFWNYQFSKKKTATSKTRDRYSTTSKSRELHCHIPYYVLQYSDKCLVSPGSYKHTMFISDTLMFNIFLSSHFQAKSIFHVVTRHHIQMWKSQPQA